MGCFVCGCSNSTAWKPESPLCIFKLGQGSFSIIAQFYQHSGGLVCGTREGEKYKDDLSHLVIHSIVPLRIISVGN